MRKGASLDSSRTFTFTCDGKAMEAHPGDTIGSAVLAAGRTVFSRSFKYHRPRGLLCCSGKCPNCLMNVNGVPSVRVCTHPASPGDVVRSQRGWPSTENDWLSALQWFSFLLPVGFYYKMFARSPKLWKRLEPHVRRAAGLGEVLPEASGVHSEHVHLHCDVAVVGGGPAGISAALAAASNGAQVYLVDDQPELGGHLRYSREITGSNELAPDVAVRLRQSVVANPNIEVFSNALAFGAYEGGLLAVKQGQALLHIRASKLVVASGWFEYPPCFEGNDLPGILLASGARRLIHLYGVLPGSEAVICGCDEDALRIATELETAGIRVVLIANERDQARVESPKWPTLSGAGIVAAEGSARVRGAVLARFDGNGKELPGTRQRVKCNLIVLGSHRAPSAELLRQSGVRFQYDGVLRQLVPDASVPDVFYAGRVTGYADLTVEQRQGELAGLQATSELSADASLSARVSELREQLEAAITKHRQSLGDLRPHILAEAASQYVCICEDVKQKDIAQSVREGFDELELVKRYSTASMGPCQGRMCLMNTSVLCASYTGKPLREVGATTARPPAIPIELGVLAGADFHPVKLSPLHAKHVAAGAKEMNMGVWKRPLVYTSVEQEWRAVRERVGVIDVSTLGRLEVVGPQAGELLDLVYAPRISSLARNRTRYGLICTDDGIIFDDGTVSRLDTERFFVTTTTGNVDGVESLLTRTAMSAALDADVANITGAYGAVNVAGPFARQTLAKLTAIHLDPDLFKYMQSAEAEVAGVWCRLLRIGFVGETGWEIHFPAAFGESIWDAVLDAGAEFGIQPFGVEAQRLLRLEKKHLVVGHDTDALSNALEAGMSWCIAWDKPDFAGKQTLAILRDRPFEQQLVAFMAKDAVDIPEGSVVVNQSRPSGRITSSRISPLSNRTIGMAWAPASLAAEGSELQVRINSGDVPVTVVHKPFYDPEGKRLRS